MSTNVKPSLKSYREATLERLKSKRPVEKRVPVLLDDTPVQDLEDAKRRAITALTDESKEEAKKAMEEATKAIEEATIYMVFRSVGAVAYDALIAENQPTEEQRKGDNGENMLWNPETFPRALIAASIYKPKMTLEDVEEMFDSDSWNGTEISDLFMAALAANTSRRTVEAGKG